MAALIKIFSGIKYGVFQSQGREQGLRAMSTLTDYGQFDRGDIGNADYFNQNRATLPNCPFPPNK